MIREGRLTIKIPDGLRATKFDGSDHGLSHCMKAVDFILESNRAINFLEIKDPDANANEDERKTYLHRLMSGNLESELKYKFRDSWLYLYGKDEIKKPINYLVLINLEQLSTETLSQRSVSLRKNIPMNGPNGPWVNGLVSSCAIFNLESWNLSFPNLMAGVDIL